MVQHLVHFGPLGFNSVYLVHLFYFIPLQPILVHLGPIWITSVFSVLTQEWEKTSWS